MMRNKVVLVIFLSFVHFCGGQKAFKHNSISKYYSFKHGISGCHEPSFEQRERNASVIFSGTIRDLEPSKDDLDTLKATVEVKRIIKGGHVLNRLPPKSFPDDNRRYVVVDGIGNSKICRSFARKRDTRIFLVNKGANGDLLLNSSLERITTENINRIDAVVKNEHSTPATNNHPTKSNQVINKDNLPQIFATTKSVGGVFGTPERDSGNTRLNHDTSIRQTMKPMTPEPTRISGCTSLHQNLDTTAKPNISNDHLDQVPETPIIKHDRKGNANIPPEDELRDPCLEKACSFGAQCFPSLDGLTARCQCQEKCDDFGDSVGSDPVCGSDGRDYANVCEMRRKGCEDMTEIEKKYDGKCDPCNDFSCPFGQLCQLDSARRPVCRCGEMCPMIFDPVCGSNGKTYANECLMREDGCRRQTDMRVIFSGECSSGLNPCSGKVCGAGEHCHVNTASEARCSCPPECPSLVRPVCGSNGRSYESECHLRRSACLEKEDVVVSRHGDCDESGPCSGFRCSNGGHCVIHNGLPMCACPVCSEEYEPVCGSDNISYSNECKLQHENCTSSEIITIRYRGRCLVDVCAHKKCDFYSVCELDSQGVSRCICPDNCEKVVAVVCGSDGVTYDNECELQHASCKQQKVVTVVSNGACDPCDGVVCEFGGACRHGKCVCPDNCSSIDDPVCASDGATYPSECSVFKASCDRQIHLEVLHTGSCSEASGSGDFEALCDESNCKFGGQCELSQNGTVLCVCNFNCDALRSPVCGSDGKTYGNECQLKEDSCRKQTEIKTLPMENCQDIDEEMCDGEPALINHVTGREYNCNRGKDICPAGSYCHKLGLVARCCKEDQLVENCVTSKFGCCSDGLTAAPGPNYAGCPNVCQCNTLGSLSTTCDPVSRQCTCRPGVGGVKCDRCNPNFWGLPKIADGNTGCLPCGCNVHGSMRGDCEQMTGKCMCRPGISGRQCNVCSNGKYLGPTGCSDVMLNDDVLLPSSILAMNQTCAKPCRFGAVCRLLDGEPECACLMNCSTEQGRQTTSVCGSDGATYASQCQMALFACRAQKNVTVSRVGPCDGNDIVLLSESPTSPIPSNVFMESEYPTDDVFVFGLLGDTCRDDIDCSVGNSFCNGSSVCACKVSWISAPDKLSCEAVRTVVPSFSGRSYMQLKRFSQGGQDLSIEIEFQPQRDDGIVFYANGGNDFVSVLLKDGFVEFRCELGSGQMLLRAPERVDLGMFHRVVASRSGKSGSLKVDGGAEVTGTSPGTLNSLNIDSPIYLGNAADRDAETLLKSIGIAQGFIGCIRSLIVKGSKPSVVNYDLTSDESPDIEKRVNVGSCASSLCSSFPCTNGGMCLETDDGANFRCHCLDGFTGVFCNEVSLNSSSSSSCADLPCGSGGTCESLVGGGFRCSCHPDYTGDRCETEREVDEEGEALFFDGFTHLQYRNAITTAVKSQAANRFEVKFRSDSMNGLLLLMRKSESIVADYLAIAVRNGKLQVSLNLGKEIPTKMLFLSSSVNVTDGDWHTLVFWREKRQAQLIVDDKRSVSNALSAPGATHLDTDGRLWIGGSLRKLHGLPEAYLSSFHGCVKYVKVDGEFLDLVVDREVRDPVSFCDARNR